MSIQPFNTKALSFNDMEFNKVIGLTSQKLPFSS